MIKISLAICSSMRSAQLVCITLTSEAIFHDSDPRTRKMIIFPAIKVAQTQGSINNAQNMVKMRPGWFWVHSTVATFEQDWLKTHDRSDRSAGHAI